MPKSIARSKTRKAVAKRFKITGTGKVKRMPILLFGAEFWNKVVNFEALADEGVIAHSDLDLFHLVETAEEGWEIVRAAYDL